MKFIFFLLISPLVLLQECYGQADSTFLGNSVKQLETFTNAYPIEKVYLHLDRNNYSPGDTIWFKAYTVAGTRHLLSAISTVLHVELTTNKDSVISRKAIPLGSAVGWGDFVLPVLTKPGSYRIRAYTNWMRNFDAEYFFARQIQVTDNYPQKVNRRKTSSGEPDVQFFPEGGDMVLELRSKIAVKCVNNKGLGEDISGSIIDNNGNEVGLFTTQHLGMGIFALLPQPGQNYKAKITSKSGKQFTVKLPKAIEDGFTLAINNTTTDSVSLRVAASARLLDFKKNASFYIIAQSAGKIYFTSVFKLISKSFTAQIAKKRFPSGIVQFTLFSGNGEPLNERLAFIKNNEDLKLSIQTDKKGYITRGHVIVNFKAVNKDNVPITGSFSASITSDELYGPEEAANSTIFSNLLLTSELKGFVEQPGYYFNDATTKTQANLDILMLTQGYHRFNWKQINAGTGLPIAFDPEQSLSVTGYLKTNHGKPIPKGKVLLFKTKGGWFRADTVTDERGRFVIDNLIEDPDSTLTYVIQGRTAVNNKNLMVSIDTIAQFPSAKKDLLYADDSPNDTVSNYQLRVKQQMKISLDKRVISLREVIIKQPKTPLNNEIMDADQTTRDFPKETAGQKLSDYLTARLRGVTFINGLPYSSRMPKDVMNILLDGSRVPPELFQTINADEVEGVQVLRTTGKTDPVTGVGNVIIITSKRGRGLYTRQETPDVITFKSNGLYKAREFYSPKYESSLNATSLTDFRSTIYWKPDIVTDKNGNSQLSFYNADVKGVYRLVVEGIDVEGNLGRQVYTYKVE